MELTDKAVKALARNLSSMTPLSYMQALDNVSSTLGHKNWNTLKNLLSPEEATPQGKKKVENKTTDAVLNFADILEKVKDFVIRVDVGTDVLAGEIGNPTALFSYRDPALGTNSPVPLSGRGFVEKLRKAIKEAGRSESWVVVDGIRLQCSIRYSDIYDCRVLRNEAMLTLQQKDYREFWQRTPFLSVVFLKSGVEEDILRRSDDTTAFYSYSMMEKFYNTNSYFSEADKGFVAEARQTLAKHRKELLSGGIVSLECYGERFLVATVNQDIRMFRFSNIKKDLGLWNNTLCTPEEMGNEYSSSQNIVKCIQSCIDFESRHLAIGFTFQKKENAISVASTLLGKDYSIKVTGNELYSVLKGGAYNAADIIKNIYINLYTSLVNNLEESESSKITHLNENSRIVTVVAGDKRFTMGIVRNGESIPLGSYPLRGIGTYIDPILGTFDENDEVKIFLSREQ